jgi:hypothetical protein
MIADAHNKKALYEDVLKKFMIGVSKSEPMGLQV